MRTVAVVVFSVFCLMPLWADEPDVQAVEIGTEYDGDILSSYFYNRIFLFEIDYAPETSFTKRVKLSWPIPEDWHSPWRFMLEVQPAMWDSKLSRTLDHEPDQTEEFYAGIQFLDESVDARLLAPIAFADDGRKLDPFIQLKCLKLWRVDDNTDIIARGFWSQHTSDFDLGASRHFGSFELKVYTDLEWSIGFRTDINTLLR